MLCLNISVRTDSVRLPRKALLPFGKSDSVLGFLLSKLQGFNLNTVKSKIVVCTSDRNVDDDLSDLAHEYGVLVYRGDSNDVLLRNVMCAEFFGAEWICRITGDSPFIDCNLLMHLLSQVDFSNTNDICYSTKNNFPVRGLDIEVFRTASGRLILNNNPSSFIREHVTPTFYTENKVLNLTLPSIPDFYYQYAPFTLDTLDDYLRLRNLAEIIDCSVKSC